MIQHTAPLDEEAVQRRTLLAGKRGVGGALFSETDELRTRLHKLATRFFDLSENATVLLARPLEQVKLVQGGGEVPCPEHDFRDTRGAAAVKGDQPGLKIQKRPLTILAGQLEVPGIRRDVLAGRGKPLKGVGLIGCSRRSLGVHGDDLGLEFADTAFLPDDVGCGYDGSGHRTEADNGGRDDPSDAALWA